MVETLGGMEPVPLANESFLMRGQVVRGPTNQVLVRFQSPSPANPGSFHFHFEALTQAGKHASPVSSATSWWGSPAWHASMPPIPSGATRSPPVSNATTGRIVSPGFPPTTATTSPAIGCWRRPRQRCTYISKVSLAEDDDRQSWWRASGGMEPVQLANESFLMRPSGPWPHQPGAGRFQSPSPANPGSFHFHFEGGQACFSCVVGYQLVGKPCLACLNATHPFWSNQEPTCIGDNNLTCHWVLEASPGQRVHLHFEKVSLAEDDDRLIIRNGNNIEAPPVYDSYEVEYLPIEGLVSTSRGFFIEFSTDSVGVAAGVALRYEATGATKWAPPWSSPVSPATPWSKARSSSSAWIPPTPTVCSGEITDASGVVLSPNWPEPYGKGQDCIWGIHVEEDKRIMLDIR
ncbi:hypothetical protein E2320_001395, partial [Naja naja]